MSQLFEVIVFTASERSYAESVVKIIDPKGRIDGILSREHCLQIDDNEFLKDLQCLNREADSIVIVDNALGAVK